MVKFSVVTPLYNEAESLKPLLSSLKKVMDKLGQQYEIIFINDCSKDKTLEVLLDPDLRSTNLVIVNLLRHYGQSQAMQAGFDIARGEIIITLDGDLQNDPEDIPKLLSKLNEGYDVVCGWRYPRKDNWLRRASSKVAYAARRIIAKEKIHDVGCTLRVFKKSVLKNVYLSKGMHRFYTLIMLKLGCNITEEKVNHCPRQFGKSKYNIRNRLLEGIINLIRLSLYDIHDLMKPGPNYKIKEVIRR